MHHPKDDGSDNERVPDTRHGVRELVRQLDEVSIEPAAGNLTETIEACDASLCEDPGEKVADYPANGM